MAEMATYIAVDPITIRTTAVAVGRGLRVIFNANTLCSVADATVRGDFITLIDVDASSTGSAACMAAGGAVPAVASEAVAPGDAAYAAAAGKVSKTSTNAALIGKWRTTTAANTLGEVILESVA